MGTDRWSLWRTGGNLRRIGGGHFDCHDVHSLKEVHTLSTSRKLASTLVVHTCMSRMNLNVQLPEFIAEETHIKIFGFYDNYG